MSNSTPKSKQIFNKIYRRNIEPNNKSVSSAKKIQPIDKINITTNATFLNLDIYINSLTYTLKNHGEFIPLWRTPLFTLNTKDNAPIHRTKPVNLQCQLIKTFET